MTHRDTGWPVWDWPVRLIHWYFPLAIGFMWWSGEQGLMELHSRCGYSLWVAAATRLGWGVVGSHHARFRHFLRAPDAVWRYLRGERFEGVGHNPLGGWSALILPLVIFIQASSGLFTADDIAFEGPLAYWGGDASIWISQWHEINWSILCVLILVHVGAIAYYQWIKGQGLIGTMWRGRSAERYSDAPPRPLWWALLLAGFITTALALIVSLAPSAPSFY